MKEKERIYTEGREDIRYRGPLSYRTFRILGWICIVLGQVLVWMNLKVRLDPEATEVLESPSGFLAAVSGLSVPLLMIANFALILNAGERYRGQLIRYFLLSGGIALLAVFLYERYLVGSAAVLLGSREMARASIVLLFRRSVPSGFIAFNLFIDLFLCTLLMFFMFYRPKHVFTGEKLRIFRLFSLIPVLYEVLSPVLKILSAEGKITLPMIAFPFLTVKPPVMFLVFLILVLYMKNRERRFLRHDRSLWDYQEFLQTNRNSFHFSRFAAIVLALAGLFDMLCVTVGLAAIRAGDPEAVRNTSEAMERLHSIGIGRAYGLLILSPVMLLFSYTKTHKHRIVDILTPLAGAAVVAWIYVMAFFRLVGALPQILQSLSSGM